MITKYSLSNFKGFKKLNDLELAPLTILVGKNSCGKSSILHSLLLLKQSYENYRSDKPLSLEGEYLKYSNLREMTFGQPDNNRVKISFEFESIINGQKKSMFLGFNQIKSGDYYNINLKDYYIKIGKNKIDLLKLNDDTIKKIITKRNLGLITKDMKDVKIIVNKLIPDSISAKIKFLDEKEESTIPLGLLSEEFNSIENEINRFIEKIKFLSPLRATPNRAYIHYTEDSDELIKDGSNAAHILWSKRNEKVKFNTQELSLINAVNECLKEVGLNQILNPEKIGNVLYQLKLAEKAENKKVPLSDVGFGYSQILPVILIGLLNNNNNLILVEQPEIHLHPSSAANLADLFLKFVNDDKRFIIETHSQEFINRLRLRVIENPELKSKINIVFIEKDKINGAQTKQFKIDENGMFPEWPEGFIDESEKLAEAILKARMNKSKLK